MQDLTYGLAMWVPFFGTGLRSSNPYSFRSSMTIAPTMQTDPRSRTIDYPALNRLGLQWRQIAPYYYGDYYPLTPYSTEQADWMAWQFNRLEPGDGMVQAFRRSQSPMESARFKLRGLDLTAQYSVRNIDMAGESQFSGLELEEKGLPVAIKDQPGAVIILYKQVKGAH